MVSPGLAEPPPPPPEAHPLAESRRRRKKANVADRKRRAVEELLERVVGAAAFQEAVRDRVGGDLGEGPAALSALFRELRPAPVDWAALPPALTPHLSALQGDHELLAGEATRQRKLRKKLLRKVEDGELDAAGMAERLATHGRDDEEPGARLLDAGRAERKCQQVESLACVLQGWAARRGSAGGTVLDAGCGSGNLCLPLAKLLPGLRFVLLDRNAVSLDIARARALDGALGNVEVVQHELCAGDCATPSGAVPAFDLAIGLHCCGGLTDLVMELCRSRGADCAVAPCCNGGIGRGRTEAGAAEAGVAYPRSQALARLVSREEYCEVLCPAADDLSHYEAKCLVELDRGLAASGRLSLLRLSPTTCSPKHHVVLVERVLDEAE